MLLSPLLYLCGYYEEDCARARSLVMMLTIIRFFVKWLSALKNLVLSRSINEQKNKVLKKLPDDNILRHEISRNILLLTSKKQESLGTKPEQKSLVVLIGWLSAQRKHTDKYAEIWMDRGFDVLSINFTTWQVLWPSIGSQVVAADTLKFLDQDKTYSRIILHGLSAGGYEWAEIMVQMVQNLDRYQHILDRINGQIWDSVADMEDFYKGFSKATFPHNSFLADVTLNCMVIYLKVFHEFVTRHYLTASRRFHTNIVKAPALLIFSKIDPIGTESTNRRVISNWEPRGIKVSCKVFEKSPHVGHYRKYPKEYVAALYEFLDSLNSNNLIEIQTK